MLAGCNIERWLGNTVLAGCNIERWPGNTVLAGCKIEMWPGNSLGPRPSFIFGFERAWYAKIRHVTSFSTSVGVSMETPPFTMTSFQSAYGQVAAWCEYSSSETDGRIAS